MLKLNGDGLGDYVWYIYSNTTLVKVKLNIYYYYMVKILNSNTTLVKVKSEQEEIDTLYSENSNTTLVKVK